jgi:hypothetical protein
LRNLSIIYFWHFIEKDSYSGNKFIGAAVERKYERPAELTAASVRGTQAASKGLS